MILTGDAEIGTEHEAEPSSEWQPDAGRPLLARSAPWLVFAAALVVHRENLQRALLGWDTYATLVAARVTTWADFTGTFTEKLMDGRLAFGDFYRPVGNLFIAFDVAIWGVDPFGHQLTSTLLMAAACALVFVVVRQRQRSAGAVPAALAAGFVVLHPAVLSILPSVARRTEILMILFVLAALAVAGRRGGSGRSLLAGAFALLAVGSKEPGLVVLPLLFVDRFCANSCDAQRGGDAANSGDAQRCGDAANSGDAQRGRVARALRFVAPATGAIAGFGILRTFVLGGLGGYFLAPESPYAARLLSHTPDYLGMVMVTGVLEASGLGPVLALACFAAVVAGLVALWSSRSSERWMPELALPALGLTWIGFQLALASTTVRPEARYVEGLVVGLAFVLAGFVDRGQMLATSLPAAAGAASQKARLLIAAAVLVSFSALAGAPLWRDQPGLAEASRVQKEELANFEARLRALPPGAHRERLRIRKRFASEDRVVDDFWMLSPWGLQAWLEMVFPERSFAVERNNLVLPESLHWNLLVIEHQTGDDG